MKYKHLYFLALLSGFFTLSVFGGNAQANVKYDSVSKTVEIADSSGLLLFSIDCSDGCRIRQINVNGKNVLSGTGVRTGIRTRGGNFTSENLLSKIKVEKSPGKIILKDIIYGDGALRVNETWSFEVAGDKIVWNIDREYSTLAKLEEMSFPQWNFSSLSVWKGGILDNGGVIWCKYLSN
ncbi:MAG: hypothetical protein LBH82_01930, partial [Bacteroidales bacterium]|nr:hypothetical protein [Bacteroidales bacterium]